MNANRTISSMLGHSAAPADVPPAFIALQQQVHPWLDRKLGYFGDARYVCFYYEPRGQEVMWKDGRSYGFGSGGWCYFAQFVAPLADEHRVTVGQTGSAARQVLVIDRIEHSAYFADRAAGEEFVESHNESAKSAKRVASC